jgi:hypothetical protein
MDNISPILYKTFSDSERLFNSGKDLADKIGFIGNQCTEPMRCLIQNDGWVPTVDIQEQHLKITKANLGTLKETMGVIEAWASEVEAYLNKERAKENKQKG